MKELLALFVNHRENDVMMHHYASLTKHGACDVQAVHLGERHGMGADLGPTKHNYTLNDAVLYRGRKVFPGYERYILIDWDCLVVGSLPVLLKAAGVWDAPVSAPSVATTHWCVYEWGNGLRTLPFPLRRFACGCVPMCGTMVSGSTLDAIAEAELYLPETHCELRLATLAHEATGNPPKAWEADYARHVRSVESELPAHSIDIRHPVKV